MPRDLAHFLLRSFRGRLTLLVAAIVGPALFLGAVLIFQAYRNEWDAVGTKLLSTARAVSGVVDGKINETDVLLKTLSASEMLDRDDLIGLDAVARAALIDDERWFVLTDANGQQLINTRLPRGASLPRADLGVKFKESIPSGKRYVSDLHIGPATKALVLHVDRPYLREGQLKYALSIGILPASLGRAINVDRYAPGSVVTVVDGNGRIIARSRNPEKFVGVNATPDIVKATAENTEGKVESVTLERIPVLAAFSRAECGWTVVIGFPKAELYASARRLFNLAVACSALLAAVALLMVRWIGQALVRSVDSLSEDAAMLGRGKMPENRSKSLEETDFVAQAMRRTADTLLRRTRTLEVLNRVSADLVAERDLEKIVQSVTDAGREVSGAAFGAFFYNVENNAGESYMLYTLSGAPRSAFERFGMPRNTPVFGPTFKGEGAVRVADITKDPRYGKMSPHHGMPAGHLSVKSYLAVPVKSRAGEVIGGLFFGHPEVNVFSQEAEDIVVGLAAEAAIAIDNAKLYQALSRELEAKSKAESELRVAQERLQEHASDLEQKVAERTASLRDAVTQMEEFSYTVSHDLRSPLRALSGYSEILIEDYSERLDEVAREYLLRIKRATERMDRLTTDVLSYSRVTRAQVELFPTDVDKIVHEIVEHFDELGSSVADVQIDSPLHRVLAHPPSLTQSLSNLLTNAVKFVKSGEKPRVKVRSEKRGNRVRIWVEDEGIGIALQNQSTLFRVFERIPTNGKYEGTGVGLAIVRKAVEKMAGSCGVESDGFTGSRFWIELAAA